jgi:type II restriction/modification system DNA methylase subunit YeeA
MIKEQEQIREYGKSYNIDEKYILPKSIKENYLKIDRLLKDIKIVDPAVGSGAFPIGMMNEIVKARSALTTSFNENEWKNRTNYNFKRETIENSLYGVDIDSSAVDIAKLRFWLSLIVDESDITDIQPLPNLDHKIMCGNSLLEELFF